MLVFFRSVLFLLTLAPSALRHQWLDWPNRIHWFLRATIVAISAQLATAFAGVFTRLPDGWADVVLTHMLSVPGVFVAVMLLAFGTVSFGLGILSAKVARTL